MNILHELNQSRVSKYRKSLSEEEFLNYINKTLQAAEIVEYEECPELHPILFVFGLPRSGTTLLTQFLAHSLDLGYINNLAARFWLAPVTGIRLAQAVLSHNTDTDFHSHYASTQHITDIHEFGYFWRYWLRKDSVSDFIKAANLEQDIDWCGLRKVLLNMQYVFDKPMVFKNIFGAYHIDKFLSVLSNLIFIYIEREPIDVAISIFKARSEFYEDPAIWWSTIPPEYTQLKDLPVFEQIAGQVYYLRRLYERQIESVDGERIVRVTYENLTKAPFTVLEQMVAASRGWLGDDLPIVCSEPLSFPYRHYQDEVKLWGKFKNLLDKFTNGKKGK